jgi:hypothetical protein
LGAAGCKESRRLLLPLLPLLLLLLCACSRGVRAVCVMARRHRSIRLTTKKQDHLPGQA